MITVREWRLEDLSQIAKLEDKCFKDPWSEEDFRSSYSLPDCYGFVLEDETEIVGYACALFLFEEGDIANVAVSFKYRRQGLGKRLLNELEAKAKTLGVERLFLEVRTSNFPARSLYFKQGFREISLRRKYYPDGEDAIVMQKTL